MMTSKYAVDALNESVAKHIATNRLLTSETVGKYVRDAFLEGWNAAERHCLTKKSHHKRKSERRK